MVTALAYADDIAVFCSYVECISNIVRLGKAFCESSGATVNWEREVVVCSRMNGRW